MKTTAKEALKILREHLKQIAFYHHGVWFKAEPDSRRRDHSIVQERPRPRDHGRQDRSVR